MLTIRKIKSDLTIFPYFLLCQEIYLFLYIMLFSVIAP